MQDSNKIPVTIYEIERMPFDKLNEQDTIGEIIRRLNVNGTKTTEIKLQQTDLGPFTIKFFSLSKLYPPTWLRFIEPIVDKKDPILKSRNLTFSFIGFIGYKKRIYAIAGGYGSFEIEQYTKPDFGLEIIVKLFEKDNRVIRSIQQRGVTGIVIGQSRFYRGDQRFSDTSQFGQICKQIQAELNMDHLVKSFGFSKKDLKRSKAGCQAKSSFKINKAISFTELLNLLKKIDNILSLNEKFALNKVFHIKGKRHEKLLHELQEEMCRQIYTDYKAGLIPDYDICNANFEEYLKADKFVIELNTKETIDTEDPPSWEYIINELRIKGSLLDNDEYEFKHAVLLKEIASYDSLNNRLTRDTLFDQLNGELVFRNESYFHIDKGWYRIEPTFIDDLNKQCGSLLQDAWDDQLITRKFDIQQDENIFNQTYLHTKGALVLDTVTPENIECCDILFHEPGNITFIHVKKGFDNRIRELAAQVSIAAKRIQETINSDYGYFDKVEKWAKNPGKISAMRKKIAAQDFSTNGLKGLVKQSPKPKHTFCLAFVDTATNKRSLLRDLTKFRSNIAKYSLIELSNELRIMGFEFKVVQIEKA